MRYIVIKEACLMADVEIIVRSEDLESIEDHLKGMDPEGIAVYELKYVAETILNRVSYEGESASLKDAES